MKNFSFPYLISILFLGIFASCSSKKSGLEAQAKKRPIAPPVLNTDMFIVAATPLSDNISLPGNILANEVSEIHPEISGRLTLLNIAEGKTVAAGELLGKIYDGDLRAQLSKLSIQLQQAQRTAKRYEELLKIQGVSQQEYDEHLLNISNIKADMAIVHSNIKRTEIRAPFSGALGLKLVSPGAYVTPATILTTIRQNTQLKLDFSLPEKYAIKIQVGQLVYFKMENNAKEYSAKIMATERGIAEDSRSLNVRALVMNNDGQILPGNFVEVTTNFAPDPNAIMVPTQAVIPQARGKKIALFKEGTAFFQDVETGLRDTSMVQITRGLKVGDTIIVSGIMSLRPNSKVSLGKIVNK
ncbi:MAG TPA: efflux RND transporter periplasmic adaptor subunit [Ferruginibacter sp.]|nr:efflux RND transporter periplasmic adaptor subunit [Ferruginibacter sp.]